MRDHDPKTKVKRKKDIQCWLLVCTHMSTFINHLITWFCLSSLCYRIRHWPRTEKDRNLSLLLHLWLGIGQGLTCYQMFPWDWVFLERREHDNFIFGKVYEINVLVPGNICLHKEKSPKDRSDILAWGTDCSWWHFRDCCFSDRIWPDLKLSRNRLWESQRGHPFPCM